MFPIPNAFKPMLLSASTLMALAVPLAHGHDITNALLSSRADNCADHVAHNSSKVVDVQNRVSFDGTVQITAIGTQCTLQSNGVPNHDFNAKGRFHDRVQTQNQRYTITAQPRKANQPTALSLTLDNAVFLNGVKLDLIAAGCHGVGDGRIGCNDMRSPFRYDPMSPTANFGTDEHNGHPQPDGAYHYHGNPMALFEQKQPTQPSPVIGFAADGFPIYGSFILANGQLRKARSSYQLKAGNRSGGPGGRYDGTFVDDWTYVAGSGDLDECNGMEQDGHYGYVVTDAYPHVMACFKGTPDQSFSKRKPR